jgi:hypothetical protein
MKQRSILGMISTRRALLCSLALTLGTVAGCGTVPDETPAGGEPEVASTSQRLDQIFDEPFVMGQFGTAQSCQILANGTYRQELLRDTDEPIDITCSLTLQRLGTEGPYETIKRPLKFVGRSDYPGREGSSSSGVILDCQDQFRPQGSPASISNGGADLQMIQIRSNYPHPFQTTDDGMYALDGRPENIMIQNCSIEGRVRIAGLQGAGDHLIESSHDTDDPEDRDDNGEPRHVARARALAPTNILFRNVTLFGRGSSPLYVSAGVTRFTMVDSVVDGLSGRQPGIYFDAESTENTILNTRLSVRSNKRGNIGREQLAVDSSSYNFIVGNRVSGLDDGGVNLYRNCGEHGTVRYTTPSYNVIVNNQFNYRKYKLNQASRDRYAVHLSSRNGPYSPRTNPYCEHDRRLPGVEPTYDQGGFPIYPIDTDFPNTFDTTFITDNDNAHDNIVTSNEFLNRPPKSYLKNSSKLNNFTAGNREVRQFSSGNKACFSPLSFGRVLLHGNTERVRLPVFIGEGIPVCVQIGCSDGELQVVSDETDLACPEPGTPIPVECRATQDNNGCQNILSCPLGQKVTSVKAACNLELGSVTDAELALVPAGNVRVVRVSDIPSDGACYVLGASASTGTRPVTIQQTYNLFQSGWPVTIPLHNGVRTVNIGCKEKDSSGGDCHVRAEFTCE